MKKEARCVFTPSALLDAPFVSFYSKDTEPSTDTLHISACSYFPRKMTGRRFQKVADGKKAHPFSAILYRLLDRLIKGMHKHFINYIRAFD